MHVCPGIKRDGGRCTAVVSGPDAHCYAHDPARAEERRRNARKAARAKPGAAREISEIKAYLEDLAEEVRGGKVDPKVGAVVNQIVNTRLRALELERHIRETDDLAAELEELKREYGAA